MEIYLFSIFWMHIIDYFLKTWTVVWFSVLHNPSHLVNFKVVVHISHSILNFFFLNLPSDNLRKLTSSGDHCDKCDKLSHERQIHVSSHMGIVVNNNCQSNRMHSCLGNKLLSRPVRDYLVLVNWDGKIHSNCWTKCCSWLSVAIRNTMNKRATWGRKGLIPFYKF